MKLTSLIVITIFVCLNLISSNAFNLRATMKELLDKDEQKNVDEDLGQAIVIEFQQDNAFIGLYGRLTVPENASATNQVPVALIIAGSGGTDLNCNDPFNKQALYTNAYLEIAEALLEQGIAVLRYNKRGLLPSYTTQPEQGLIFNDFAEDAARLINYLKKDDRFNEFYIMGHSEGSSLGMIAITQYLKQGEIQGYVSLEGAGFNIADVLEYQLKPQFPETVFDEIVEFINQLQQGQIPETCPPLMELYQLCKPGTGLFRPTILPYMVSWMQFYPQQTFAMMTYTKNMVTEGTTDLQVPVINGDVLHEANPQAKYIIYEEMNHILKNAPSNVQENLATYVDPSLPLHANLAQDIIDLIKS